MENLKFAGKFCALVFVLGAFQVSGMRVMEFIWPKQETVRIVHYLCAEDDDGDVACGRIKDEDISALERWKREHPARITNP